MKSMIEKTLSIRALALLLALCATTSAWAVAPTPTAVWEAGQFEDAANLHGGYSITLPTGATIVNGNIVLAGTEATGAIIDVGSSETSVSVLIKYSGVSAPSKNCVFVSTYVTHSNGSYDMCAISKGASLSLQGTYDNATNNGNYWAFANPAPALGASGYFLFTYHSGSGTAGYSGSTIDSLTGGKNGSLKAGSRTISKVSLGGPTGIPANTFPTWDSGVTIEAVAIFVGQELNNTTISDYTFPSDDPLADYDYAATISANRTFSDITTWTKGTGTPGTDSKVYIASENNAVLTISGALNLGRLRMVGGSITLADGASVSSTQIDGADINIAASTEVTISDSDILSKIICSGVLNTSGTTSLQGENEFTATSTLNVGGTKTSLNAGSGKLSGTINVLDDAELENTRSSDALNYGGSANVNIKGTLNMGSTRWTIGGSNTITLHEGAVVTCANNNGNGALNWNIKNSTPNMIVDGNATLSARIKIIDSATLTIDVASGKTLTIETGGFLNNGLGPVKKTGLGVISNTATTFNINALTVSQGKFISTEFPSGTVSIADGATFTLKDKAWTDQPSRFTGTGTLELRSESANCKHTVTGVTFPGIIKLSNVNTHITGAAPYWQNNIAPASADMFAENIRPEFILDSDLTHLGDGYYCNNAEHPLRIKNLSGSGEFRGQWSSSVYKYVVETLQERNTTYDGTLGCDASGSNPRCVSLSVIGNNPSEIHSLTITQAINGNDDIGCQTSTLTVADDAKVVFASTGKWGYGNIIVNEDGWLESTNTTAAANITLNDGSTIVVPYVNSATVPLGGTTVTLPADGTVYFDMNGVNIAGGTTVTVISATTLNNGSTASFAAKSGKWDFNVVGNTVTATKKVLSWDGSSWSDDDYSGYTEASIAVSGEASVTLPATLNLQKMALTGSSGSLTIVANNNTLTVGDVIIPNGVTLVASSALTITGVVSGGGSLVVEGTNLTVYDGKTWTVNSVVVNGTLTLGGATSSIAGTVTGAGKIVYPAGGVFPTVTGLSAAGWTGEVEVPAYTPAGNSLITFNDLGNSSSTVVLDGINLGAYWAVGASESGATVINPTVRINGSVTFTFTSSSTTFSQVTGDGNLSLDACDGQITYRWVINTLANFSGTVGVSSDGQYNCSLSIGTLALDGGLSPTVSDRLVKIDARSTWANIINVADTAVTIGGNATEYKLVKKNVGTATAGLYLAPAVIKDKSGNLTPYETVQAAFTAVSSMSAEEYSAFSYVAVYETATVAYANQWRQPKVKIVGEDVVLTVNYDGADDYCWVAGQPDENGVSPYTPSAKATTYTWVGADNNMWQANFATSWKYDSTHFANRPLQSIDAVVFDNDSTVTLDVNAAIASVTISGDVTFTATIAKTITVGDGGVVLSAAGASITLTNVTLSKVPTTSVANYAVQTTVVDGTTTYTAVPAVATVDAIGYATIAEAEEALKTGAILDLLEDYDGTVTLYPNTMLRQNGNTVTRVVGADRDGTAAEGIVVNEMSPGIGVWVCYDYRTATWCGTSGAAWIGPINWDGGFVPQSATAVTIPATDGHATAITLTADVSIKSLTLGAGETLTLSAASAVTLTTASAIVLTSGQSLVTGSNVTISPAITTSDAHSYIASTTDGSGNTTYTVAVYAASVTDSSSNVTDYATVAGAVSAATTGDTISLNADSIETIALNDKTINFSEGSYTFSGTFTGNGTVVLGAALKSASSDRWPVGWTGTVELKAITSVIADFNFAHYGNANSKVKANNVLIRLNPEATGTDVGGVGAIEVASGGLKFGGTKIVDKIFYISATITGSGTISVGTPGGETDDAAHKATCTKYVFSGDYSAFRGAVNFSGASSYRAGIVFRNGSDTIPTQTDWGQIIVTENATLTTSGTLDGAGGFIIEGEIDLLSGGSVTTGGAKIGGDGLIVLTEGSSGALASSKFNSAKWTGVVELKNITTAIDSFDFVNYGTANSTVRANGVTVKENDGAIGNVGCIDVAAGGLTFGNSSVWKNGKTISIAADITGSGPIVVATPVNAAHGYTYYVFTGDVSGFAGSVRAQSAWSSTYDSVIVFKDAEDEMPTATAYRQMFVTENASVNIGASATWTASTLTVDGTINVASGGALSGTVKGGGTVSFAALPASALTFSSWTGTVVLPSFAAGGQNFNNFGVEGSKVQLTGITSGWLNMGTQGSDYTINPEVVLAGNMTLTDSSNRSWIFKKVSGTGNLSLTPGASGHKITIRINDLASTIGTISNNMGGDTTWTIDELSFPAETELPAGTKLLSTGGDGAITLESITVGGNTLGNISYSRNPSGAEGDGFYVNAAATTTGTGESAVTTVTTDATTTSVSVALDAEYSGKIALPGNVTTLTVTGPTITADQLQLVTTQGTYDGILALVGTAVSLNRNAYYQNGEGEANKIYVEPKTAASDPMTMPGATTAPSFSIKTIPGLYYVVWSGTDTSSLTAGSATQATTTTTGLAGPALGNVETVRYYQISVGRTADEAQQP